MVHIKKKKKKNSLMGPAWFQKPLCPSRDKPFLASAVTISLLLPDTHLEPSPWGAQALPALPTPSVVGTVFSFLGDWTFVISKVPFLAPSSK